MADDETKTTPEEDPQGDPSPERKAEPEQFDEARAKATIEAQRASEKAAKARAATAEKELETLRKEKQDRADAEKTEVERLTARADAAEKAATAAADASKLATTRYEVVIAANKLNIIDPEAAFVLLDRALIEYGDDGKPSNVEALLKELVKAKTYLLKPDEKREGPPGSPKGSDGKGMTDQQKADASAQYRASLNRKF